MFVTNIVNIDDDNNDRDENRSSFDRRCILFVSNVERKANKGLRACSLKREKKYHINEILINISSKYR